jgi:hypothetical protein
MTYINNAASHDSGDFTSRVYPTGSHTLPEPRNNIQAIRGGKNKKNMKSFRKSHRRNRQSRRRKSRKMRGGSQYQNNLPMTQTYSTGGVLSSKMSAMANPVPYKLTHSNCADNYSHFKHSGVASKGWW